MQSCESRSFGLNLSALSFLGVLEADSEADSEATNAAKNGGRLAPVFASAETPNS